MSNGRNAWRLAPLALGASLCACVARYHLRDSELAEAKAQNSLETLRVYPSNRTISMYDEALAGSVTVSREIRQRTTREQRKRILTRDTSGAVVGEDMLNGAPLLWVTFDRQCAEPRCAYGFVQVDDGKYLLLHAPDRDGFQPPAVYRDCALPRRKMTRGHLHALSEANTVYRLQRGSRSLTVFLEVKKDVRSRVRRQSQHESGV